MEYQNKDSINENVAERTYNKNFFNFLQNNK